MGTKSSREMQKDREKIRPPFGGLKFCQGTHYLPLTFNPHNLHYIVTKKEPIPSSMSPLEYQPAMSQKEVLKELGL